MSALTFELKGKPDQRLDLSPLIPERLAKLSRKEIEALAIGTTRTKRTVGDAFNVKGNDASAIRLVGTDGRCDGIGAGLAGGEIVIDGHAGAELGARMKRGKIEIKGSVGALAGASMAGGTIAIARDAGDQAAGVATGDTTGMKGGFLTIGGQAGALLGERMRKGLVVVSGRAGDYAGGRMIAGTLVLKRGAGRYAGYGNRRGSLIFMEKPKDILPTFNDCGVMEFDYLRLLELWLRGTGMRITLGGRARRLMGDMAVLGKGEILTIT